MKGKCHAPGLALRRTAAAPPTADRRRRSTPPPYPCRAVLRIHGLGCYTSMQTMTDEVVPHFHNEPGVPVIEIGAKKFMCIGALPPQDHPHVCKIACNIDPLRGIFASSSDPF